MVVNKWDLVGPGRKDGKPAADQKLFEEQLREALELFALTGSVAASEALLGLAAVANARDDPSRAALLLGASDRIAKEIGHRDVAEARLYDDTLRAVHAALGDTAAAELVAEGEKLQRHEAIAYALAS